jgi:predicted anti-sigma-YlaC factor YlaD
MALVVNESSCARARRALSLVLDYEAELAEIEALAVHLGRCSACRRYAAVVSAFTRYLRRVGANAGTQAAVRALVGQPESERSER